MAVFRINKTDDYTIISNHHLKNKKMSLRAKGLLSLMLSLPDNWDYSVDGLVSLCKENVTVITTTLKELKTAGHLVVDKLMPNQTTSGRIEYVYNIFEFPIKEIQGQEKQDLEKQEVEFQDLEKQDLEKQPQLNTNILNTNKENTNILNTNNNIAKEKQVRHKYGNYGRVLLTDAEMNRLIEEFGEEPILKQIELLDEYIESNNNKNKYTNFNLVLRKSIRENWFNNNRNIVSTKKDPEWLKDYVNHFESGVDDL